MAWIIKKKLAMYRTNGALCHRHGKPGEGPLTTATLRKIYIAGPAAVTLGPAATLAEAEVHARHRHPPSPAATTPETVAPPGVPDSGF
jgi:hypothetical protein